MLLKKKGWSLNSLSLDSETSASTIYEMRRRKLLPRFKTLCMICDALEISLYEFFYWEEDISSNAYSIFTDLKSVSKPGQDIIIELIKLLKKDE